jgi:hypothetical protein
VAASVAAANCAACGGLSSGGRGGAGFLVGVDEPRHGLDQGEVITKGITLAG